MESYWQMQNCETLKIWLPDVVSDTHTDAPNTFFTAEGEVQIWKEQRYGNECELVSRRRKDRVELGEGSWMELWLCCEQELLCCPHALSMRGMLAGGEQGWIWNPVSQLTSDEI